jgi:oxygen-independent coproporphyrinogen-3 oxidase
MKAKPALKARYIDALCQEIAASAGMLTEIKTVYIGGGTPLSVSAALFMKLLEKLAAYIDLHKLAEFTVEANPNDITPEILPLLRFYGVSRINLGVQSFNAGKLKILGRNHDKKTALAALRLLRESGFSNIGVDIIYGVDHKDSFRKVKADLRRALKAGVTHISLYALILEEKTILMRRLNKGLYIPAPDDRQAEIYYRATRYLKRKGLNRYELSNFARPGFESKHNLVYWNNEHYLGLGAGAAGYLGDIRYVNARNLEAYFGAVNAKKPAYGEHTKLTLLDKMKEEVILGLRKTEGINTRNFSAKYEKNITEVFPVVEELFEKGLLKLRGENLFIPEDKLFLSNEVLINFI